MFFEHLKHQVSWRLFSAIGIVIICGLRAFSKQLFFMFLLTWGIFQMIAASVLEFKNRTISASLSYVLGMKQATQNHVFKNHGTI